MPIAHCFVNGLEFSTSKINDVASVWSVKVGVDIKDICLNFVTSSGQGGQSYHILVNLFLPSVWTKQDMKRIQISLLEVLGDSFHIHPHDIFIMTTIIESGHVVENGKVVIW